VVLVELEEDPALRLVGNVLDAAPHEVEIGRRVEVPLDRQAVGRRRHEG
jgi:uncharacterized OB-fold protein